jgi:RNA polymerase sigma-70 factor (ECF subfamily)
MMSISPDRLTPNDPAQWLAEHGDTLFRYALARLGDQATAEDLVQETFLAALRTHRDFAERSAEQTWLVGILRHKIADHYRRRNREPAEDSAEAASDCWFDARGHWRAGPSRWPRNPTAMLEDREFWEVFKKCLAALPPQQAEAFCGRELDEKKIEELCAALEITATNLRVRLHRARLRLRRCLEANWFQTKGR